MQEQRRRENCRRTCCFFTFSAVQSGALWSPDETSHSHFASPPSTSWPPSSSSPSTAPLFLAHSTTPAVSLHTRAAFVIFCSFCCSFCYLLCCFGLISHSLVAFHIGLKRAKQTASVRSLASSPLPLLLLSLYQPFKLGRPKLLRYIGASSLSVLTCGSPTAYIVE